MIKKSGKRRIIVAIEAIKKSISIEIEAKYLRKKIKSAKDLE